MISVGFSKIGQFSEPWTWQMHQGFSRSGNINGSYGSKVFKNYVRLCHRECWKFTGETTVKRSWFSLTKQLSPRLEIAANRFSHFFPCFTTVDDPFLSSGAILMHPKWSTMQLDFFLTQFLKIFKTFVYNLLTKPTILIFKNTKTLKFYI